MIYLYYALLIVVAHFLLSRSQRLKRLSILKSVLICLAIVLVTIVISVKLSLIMIIPTVTVICAVGLQERFGVKLE